MLTMKKWIPHVSLLICCMIWGTTFVAIKKISLLIDPYLLATLRSLLAVLVLLPTLLILKKKHVFFDIQAIKYGFITGLILGAIYVIQTTGMQFTSSNHSAFITSSAVIMVPIIVVFTGKQKLHFTQIACIVLIAFGLYFLTNTKDNQPYNVGDLITFFGAMVCASHIILSGRYVRKTEFLGLIFYQFLFSMLTSLCGMLIHHEISHTEINFSPLVINNVLYLGFFGTLVCFFVTVWAQKFVSTITTAMILSLEPIFAATTSYIVLQESLSSLEIIGGVAIILGLITFNILDAKSGVGSN